jgi:hypothetical protein
MPDLAIRLAYLGAALMLVGGSVLLLIGGDNAFTRVMGASYALIAIGLAAAGRARSGQRRG